MHRVIRYGSRPFAGLRWPTGRMLVFSPTPSARLHFLASGLTMTITATTRVEMKPALSFWARAWSWYRDIALPSR